MEGDDVFEIISSKRSQKPCNSIHDYIIDTGYELDEDQPFYLFDLADILWKTQLWYERLPNVVPYYAVKANADPILMRLFVLLGYGFDCSTEGEIRLALKTGADPKKIIFAHTVKLHKALRYAASVGVDLMTFDSKEELHKIQKEFSKSRLILRLKSASTQTVYNLSRKFGCDLSEAEGLLQEAKDLKLNVVGVSFHVGALCEDPETFTSTIENSRLVFEMAQRLGFNFTIMDIGAGFFGSTEREGYFCKLTKEIKRSLEENFPNGDVDFIAEPGCYCVGSAVSLVTRIIGKRSTKEHGKNDLEKEYFVNDGYYGSFFEHKELYDIRPIPVLTDLEMKKRSKYRSRIWGQTCCSEDMILENCEISDMEVGELIIWENMGAYGRGVTSDFTIVPFPANRHIFIQSPRLKLNSIPNQEKVIDYISKVADLVKRSKQVNGYIIYP